VQFYIARLQKFSDVLTAENKNVFSFAAKVQTVQFNIRMDFCGAEEKNGGRGTDSPGGRHPNRTNGNHNLRKFLQAGCPSCRPTKYGGSL